MEVHCLTKGTFFFLVSHRNSSFHGALEKSWFRHTNQNIKQWPCRRFYFGPLNFQIMPSADENQGQPEMLCRYITWEEWEGEKELISPFLQHIHPPHIFAYKSILQMFEPWTISYFGTSASELLHFIYLENVYATQAFNNYE